jgi:biotin carboxyl carrier protein
MKLMAVVGGKNIPLEIVRKEGRYCLTLAGKTLSVDAVRPDSQTLSLLVEGESYEVWLERTGNTLSVHFYNDTIELDIFEARKFKATEIARRSGPSGPVKVLSPMPGKIVKIAVTENSPVTEGAPLLIMEAMKMQNELKAPRSGTVKQVYVKEGEPVLQQQELVLLE